MQIFSTSVSYSKKSKVMDMFDITFGNLSDTIMITRSNEKFSLTGFSLRMKRSPTPYFTNVYLPTTLLTLTSYIGFFIPVDKEEGRRITLLVTVFLMMVNISSTERNRGPQVKLSHS